MRFTLLLILLTLSADILYAQNNCIIADHKCIDRFESIIDSDLSKAISLKLMFRHASVGGTIDDGLDCLQGTRNSPSECTVFSEYKYDRRNWEFQPRGNSGWYGKVDDFVEQVNSQQNDFEIFSFKYCYLDGIDGLEEPCGKDNDPVKIEKAWDYLREKMEELEETYPEKIFVWWTIPLTQTGQLCTETLNKHIRNYVKEKGKILFDIADIECHDPEDKICTNENSWEVAYKGYCGEQKPDAQACHPNWTGKLLLAKAFWWMMTEIAGRGISSISNLSADNKAHVSPNPFNQLLIMNYELRMAGKVKIDIYNSLGNKIATLIDEHQVAGRQRAMFDAAGLPQGMYYYTISTGDHIYSGQMMLAR